MRKLRIVVSRRGTVPALVLATLATGAACSDSVEVPASDSGAVSGAGAAGGGGGGAGGTGMASSSTGFGAMSSSSSSSSSSGTGGGEVMCAPGEVEQTFEVEVPPDGVPADPGQICAVVMSPVDSNGAARVSLTRDAAGPHVATGSVEIAAALAGLVVGLPTIELVDATSPNLFGMQVSNVAPGAGGFTFQASWPAPFQVDPSAYARVTLKTTFELACGPNGSPTRTVEAITYVQLCDGVGGALVWISSSELCTVCDIIAEMAPSPIVPEKHADGLPLARALRARVVRLARVGRAVLLLAENDGGPGLVYGWHASGGRVQELAPDVILWDPPDERGPHLIQAVVEGAGGAVVAAYVWQDVAS